MMQSISPNERFVYVGNRVKAPVEAIGTYRLILDTGHHLDIFQTFYVHTMSRNLVSLSNLIQLDTFLKFGNKCFSLFKHNCFLGFIVL